MLTQETQYFAISDLLTKIGVGCVPNTLYISIKEGVFLVSQYVGTVYTHIKQSVTKTVDMTIYYFARPPTLRSCGHLSSAHPF